ncbi:MAG: 3-hydroxyacyl-CoA dehydrogenase/enoyl-CoA hydratase family protein [Deltaproteobacteria bacterium]|nr:3-hydroxyacyl-CoA dehydrogenase/enoyl-CoA hydratase family protein [Deltaproteobacteria bacterium]MCW5803236.1 3-hydroxyacyl-CoA dehydrogenase/enoyl-CoA hydratase family protein [Deltaproteobacteria bacterium]
MLSPIRRVAVLGAGVMGSGIAAHCANAGIPVLLLDIVPPDAKPGAPKAVRDKFAAGGLAKLAKAKPPAFMHPRNAALVTVGNFDDDLAAAGACDLIVEAIVERLDVKQQLFAKLEQVADGSSGPSPIIASNTSGLRISDMLAGRSEWFRQHFVVTHFFNPPRYMKLLELVAGPETRPEVCKRVEDFGRELLGKGIVWAKDTPNFIGNRIGLHSMMTTIHLMLERGLAPEDVDAITGAPMGHPRSATFRTADVVGLDTVGHVAANCYKTLVDDEDRATFAAPAYITKMIENSQLGDKTGGGFYKKVGSDIQTLDPATGAYRPKGGDKAIASACKSIASVEDVRARVAKLVADEGTAGKFAWTVLSRSLAYAARRIPEITDSVEAVDDAMKWGYAWELGPFETWDALGFAKTYDRMKADGLALPAWVDKMRAANATAFYAGDRIWDPSRGDLVARQLDPREATWEVMRRGGAPVLANKGAECWDLGDGVLGLTFKTKMNSIDDNVIKMLHEGVERAEQDFRALVIWNQGEHFCVGADLFSLAGAIGRKEWDGIRTMVRGYQGATQRMKYAQVPVVAAPWYATIGGGLEICLGATAVQAYTETVAGLVEVGVGLIPGGAGTLNLLWRALEGVPQGTDVDTYAFVTQVFKNIALAERAWSAEDAKARGFFRQGDGVSFDRARQLHEACRRAIGLAEAGHHPPVPRAYKLPGESGIATLQMLVNTLVAGKYATPHDATIAMKLARVLCGGTSGSTHAVTEDEILELECEAFLSLCGEPLSQARMQYFLMNQKPLRN